MVLFKMSSNLCASQILHHFHVINYEKKNCKKMDIVVFRQLNHHTKDLIGQYLCMYMWQFQVEIHHLCYVEIVVMSNMPYYNHYFNSCMSQ